MKEPKFHPRANALLYLYIEHKSIYVAARILNVNPNYWYHRLRLIREKTGHATLQELADYWLTLGLVDDAKTYLQLRKEHLDGEFRNDKDGA